MKLFSIITEVTLFISILLLFCFMNINAMEIIAIIGQRIASTLEIINTGLPHVLGVKLSFYFKIISLARSKVVVLNCVHKNLWGWDPGIRIFKALQVIAIRTQD